MREAGILARLPARPSGPSPRKKSIKALPALICTVDEGEDEEVRGGTEPDIRTLHYWSRVAFLLLVCGGIVWAALGVLRLYRGLVWYELDDVTGSTASVDDISWGVACLVLAVLAFLTAGRLQLDIVSVFGQRRFQVPRDRLVVYGMLGFPFGLVGAGVLLVLVNVKLSHPEFLPSHAEAYPEAMPGYVLARAEAEETALVPRAAAELPPLEMARPPPSEMVMMPVGTAQPAAAPQPPPVPVAGGTAAETAPVMAAYEELPAPPGAAPPPAEAAPVAAVYEEMPAPAPAALEEAPVVAAYEEIIPEIAPQAAPPPLVEEPVAPKDIRSAHEELMRKLLMK
jgi:hypothetical protein